jgi:hypothetical protein
MPANYIYIVRSGTFKITKNVYQSIPDITDEVDRIFQNPRQTNKQHSKYNVKTNVNAKSVMELEQAV